MAAPTKMAVIRLKRIGKYLINKKRMKQVFEWGGDITKVRVQTDSDWASDRSTRRSVSGRARRLGTYLLKTWSKDQGHVTKSSCEAELYAACYGSDHGLAMQSILRDLGVWVLVEVEIDSSAAIGVVGRMGIGELRHIEVHDLWLQEAQR